MKCLRLRRWFEESKLSSWLSCLTTNSLPGQLVAGTLIFVLAAGFLCSMSLHIVCPFEAEGDTVLHSNSPSRCVLEASPAVSGVWRCRVDFVDRICAGNVAPCYVFRFSSPYEALFCRVHRIEFAVCSLLRDRNLGVSLENWSYENWRESLITFDTC